MKLFLIVLVVFALAMLAMAIGVILSNRRLPGSCGGLAGQQDESGRPLCAGCHHSPAACSSPDDSRQDGS